MKKLGLLVMPLMTVSLLASCGGFKTTTYTLTFDCPSCKVLNTEGKELTKVDIPITEGPEILYAKFYLKGAAGYHNPLESAVSVKKGEEAISFEYFPKSGEIIVPVTGNLTITAQGINKTLEECTWAEISEISTSGRAEEFFDVYDPTKPTLNCKKVQLKPQDTNNNGKIDGDEFYQTVRIIGIEQDYTDPNDRDNTKVGITFDFADLISDASGSYLGCVWNDTSNAQECSYHYDTSTIFKNLNDEEGGSARWYLFGETKKSSVYKDSVLSMLPDDLAKAIIPVSKSVNTSDGTFEDFKETPVTNKLFLLCPKEMGTVNEEVLLHSESDVPVYKFYEGCTQDDEGKKKLVKRQANNEESAYKYTEIEEGDLECGYIGYNHAGWVENYVGMYYFRSPDTSRQIMVKYRSADLTIQSAESLRIAYGVAPAFCI